MMEWSLSVRSALEAENALEASLRQSMESLEPSLRPPFSLAIPNPDQYALLNRATHIKHLHSLVTDGYATFLNLLLNLVLQLFPKLLHPVKTQLLCLTHQMLRVSASHSSQDNFMLCSHLSALFFQHFDRFLEDAPHVLSSALYTFLRVLSYHSRVNVQNENFEALKRFETHLCVKIVREEFHLCLKIGRDVIRLMQDLVHVPEFKAILHDILFNPSVFNVVGFKDVSQIYCSRTSSRYSLLRISPEMETQLRFLLTNIKLGHHKRHQVWFANKFLNEPDKEFVIVDIVRFICCGHHPPNEIIQSDIFPRWALIGWLLTCCKSKHVEASVKLALFYDWLFFDERVDSIMNIEPAILLMVHSLPKFVHMTHALLEFLLHLVDQYDSGRKGLIVKCVSSAFQLLVSKGVVRSLDVLTACSALNLSLREGLKRLLSDGKVGTS